MKIRTILLIFAIAFTGIYFLINLVTALNIEFFYNDNCPHCQKMKPIVQNYIYNGVGNWDLKNMNSPENQKEFNEYGFTGVPAFVININDDREITFTGADTKRLNCEINEMTTKECSTYSADTCLKGSWFKW